MKSTALTAGVRVVAAGRLHMGFFDPSATLGRRFGSLGLCVDGLSTELEIRPADVDSVLVAGRSAEGVAVPHGSSVHEVRRRLTEGLRQLREQTGCRQPLAIHLRAALPEHAGLGSGTQLALALGRAFVHLHGLQTPTRTLAQWLGRGLRSGIGIAGFDQGGLLIDGGPSSDGLPGVPLSRIELPPQWRIVLALDPRRRGLSGEDERRALAQLAPLGKAQAADICHHVLMAVLPGAACGEFATFARGVNHVQQVLGDHFCPVQEGRAWTSPAVGSLMEWWKSQGSDRVAIGQTSWGPTGFAIVPSAQAASQGLAEALAAGQVDPTLQVHVLTARNCGASVGPPIDD